MATVPTGYVFWDVSASKSYAAGTTFPTLGNGDYLVPAGSSTSDGYYHTYFYHTSYSDGRVTYTNCWNGYIGSAYYSSSNHKLPFNTIADKPVRCFEYTGCKFTSCPTKTNSGSTSTLQSNNTNLRILSFYKCTNMTSAPALPTSLTSMAYCFYNTKITSVPTLPSTLQYADYCFYGCKQITTAPNLSSYTSLVKTTGMFQNCTGITSPPTLPPNVLDVGYMFYGCTNLVSAPTIPSKVTSTYAMFQKCTNLTGNILIQCYSPNANYMFSGTTKQIILLWTNPGGDNNYSTISSIASNYSNVYPGTPVQPVSFTAIRGIYENGVFTETVSGTYCLLNVSFTAPNVSSALLLQPVLNDGNGNEISTTWYLNTLSGTVISSSGISLPTSGKAMAVINLGSSESSEKYNVKTRGSYTVNNVEYIRGIWIEAQLTTSNALIDINPLGKGIAFWGEVDDAYDGMDIKNHVEIEKNFYLDLDSNSSSGNDYDIRTCVGWHDLSNIVIQ